MTPSRILTAGVAAVAFLFVLIFGGKIFEDVDAGQIVVVQSPLSGSLTWYTTPGVKWQGFGQVTVYKKLSTSDFSQRMRFYDGGHGTLVGSLNYALPLDVIHLTQLHTSFGSQEAIQKAVVEKITNKCVYLTGPLMSSKESYAERRSDLISDIEDQIVNGIYRTTQKDVKAKDQMTGTDKMVTVVEIIKDEHGTPQRQDNSILQKYGITVSNFAIAKLDYEDTVEKQINQQQELTMAVQTAIATSKTAEQQAITVAKQGEAAAAKAKWDQEVIKAQKVTEAEQAKEVAELDAQTAAAEKRANILRGEGESARKKLVMAADGGLDPKLQALVEINKNYAEAIKGYSGAWVPSVVMGGEAKAGSGAMQLVDMLSAKTARDLSLDVSVPGKDETK